MFIAKGIMESLYVQHASALAINMEERLIRPQLTVQFDSVKLS